MATYFVASGGSNTAPYDTWAKAATSLATALAAATAAGDVVVIQYNAVPATDSALGADTTYTIAGNVAIISASNDGGSAWTYTAMGTANFIGHSSSNRSITVSGGGFVFAIHGLTLRTSGSTNDQINLHTGAGSTALYAGCLIWGGNTNAAAHINIGGTAAVQNFTHMTQCTFRFGNTSQRINIGSGGVELVAPSISASGSSPTTIFGTVGTATGCCLTVTGGNLSIGGSTLVGDSTAAALLAVFDRVTLPASFAIATQTEGLAGSRVWLRDCHSDDTHGFHGYYDALGSVISDTGIYFTSGAAAQSWKIVTSAAARRHAPFITPPIAKYVAAGTITPYLEVLRDGSSTAYTDAEVWALFLGKVNTNLTAATIYSDAASLGSAGSSQAAGAGTGSWTGENATAWSGKIDSGSSMPIAEVGDLTVQICVGAASTTVYVDPQIRT
jgi:hypothetical protein